MYQKAVIITALLWGIASTSALGQKNFTTTTFNNDCEIVIDTFRDHLQCLSISEKKAIAEHHNTIQRNGDVLCIKVTAGQPVCFTNNPGYVFDDTGKIIPEMASSDIANYFFIDMVPKQPIAVIYSLHYEWTENRIISTATGNILFEGTEVYEMLSSPDDKLMLITTTSPDAEQDGIYDLTIYTITANQPWIADFTLPASSSGFELNKVTWVNNTEIAVTKLKRDADGEPVPAGAIHLTYNGTTWQVQ